MVKVHQWEGVSGRYLQAESDNTHEANLVLRHQLLYRHNERGNNAVKPANLAVPDSNGKPSACMSIMMSSSNPSSDCSVPLPVYSRESEPR